MEINASWALLVTCLVCALSQGHGYQYVGCFADGHDRDLPHHAASGCMNPYKCNELCADRGFAYFALQDSNDCHCGNSFGKHGGARPADECGRTCTGDGRFLCGGAWRNSVFSTDFDKGFRYIGCFADTADRDLPQLAQRGSCSVARCHTLCRQRGAPYFAVQDGNDCWCGQSYGKHGQRPVEECNGKCNGNAAELCGGPWRNSIYVITG